MIHRISAASLCCLTLLTAANAQETGLEPAEPKAKTPPPPIVKVSKETTHVTEPVTKLGYVDFAAAINAETGKGVSYETNAAVAYVRLLGPTHHQLNELESYGVFVRTMLGIPELPADGQYLVPLKVAVERSGNGAVEAQWDAYIDQEGTALEGPWQDKDCPLVAQWLTANKKVLDTFTADVNKPHWYMPLVKTEDDEMLIAVLLPGIQDTRMLARLYIMRANHYIAVGKPAEARRDLLTVHRFARHVSRGPTLIEILVGIACDAMACDGDRRLAESNLLKAEELIAYRKELEKLPAMADVRTTINRSERYMFLDTATHLGRGTTTVREIVDMNGDDFGEIALGRLLAQQAVDWNETLKMGNAWYDKLDASLAESTYRERAAATAKLADELEDLLKDKTNWTKLALTLFKQGPRKVAGQKLGHMLISLMMPSMTACHDAEARSKMNVELTRLSLTLAAYHSDNGRYPKQLAELVPKYMNQLPTDFYAEQPLHYQRTKAGYKLYAVGPNGKDDAGAGPYTDSTEDGDDLTVIVPRPERQE